MKSNTRWKRVNSLILTVCMIISMLPMTAFTESDAMDFGTGLGIRGEISAFSELDEDIAVQTVGIGTPEGELKLPGTLAVTVTANSPDTSTDIGAQKETIETTVVVDRWNSEPKYDGNTIGVYIFTPSLTLQEGLTVTEGVYAPQSTVVVEEIIVPQALDDMGPMSSDTVTDNLSMGGTLVVDDLTVDGSGTSGGGTWTWDAAMATLTLTDNGTIDGDGEIIFTATGDVTITVNGTVTATALHHNSFTAGKLTINGSGTLNVSNDEPNQDAIKARGELEIADVTLNTSNTGDDYTLYAQKGFKMESGTLNLATPDSDGIGCGNDILIGGTAQIKTNPSCARTVLRASGNVTISGGTVDVTSTRMDAIKATGDISISGGTVNCMGYDYVINSNGGITVSGGTVKCYAQSGVVIYSGGITVNGGTLITGDKGANGSILANLTIDNAAANVTINGDIGKNNMLRALNVSDGTVRVTGTIYGNINVTGGTVSLRLFLMDSPAYDIPESIVGRAISDIDLSTAVKYGTEPFEFLASGLPAGITINGATGVISGTPTSVTNGGTATISVTDSTGVTESITIDYGAVSPVPETSGFCGDPRVNSGKDVTWNLDTSTGVLTIAGTGNMANYNYNSGNHAPWYFYYKDNITAVVIESGVSSIGRNAFSRCPNLSSVSIPSSVTTLGGYAFEYCVKLTSITIPHGVTILNGTFKGCEELVSISIPSSVTNIDGAFEGCKKLTSITIPDGVTIIGDNTFRGCTSLSSLTIPEGVTSIGLYAFSDCKALSNIIIPNKVTSIGYSAFSDCTKLTGIIIPASVTSIDHYAFGRCSSLASVTFMGKTPPVIQSNAFIDVAATGTVTYPTGSETIYATALAATHLSDWIPIGGKCGENVNWSLNKSTGTLTISGTGPMADYGPTSGNQAPWYSDYKEKITVVVIESGITNIGKYAFYNCTKLSSVTIPSSVTIIGTGAFVLCVELANVTIPSSVTTIDGVFTSCTKLVSITIPAGITSIGKDTFKGCTSLSSVTIPESVTSIGERAFLECKVLSSVIIPDSVTSIGNGAFYGCTNLAGITIPNSVTIIGNQAFSNCTGLSSITIGNKVNVIGDYAFRDCTNLASVRFMGTTPPTIGVDAFNNVANSGTVFSPAGTEGTYATALAGTNIQNWIYKPIMATYTATLHIRTNGVADVDNMGSYKLKLSSDETQTVMMEGNGQTRTAIVSNGVWKVYGVWNDGYLGLDITIEDSDNSQTLDWYIISYGLSFDGTATNGNMEILLNGKTPQGAPSSLQKGDKLVLTASGTGAASYTYAWSGSHGANTISSIENTYRIDSVEGPIHINCIITGSGTVTPEIILDRPYSVTVVEGNITESITINARASNGKTISYQWYKGITPIVGATGESFQIPNDLTEGNYQYWCHLKAEGCADKKPIFTVVVNPPGSPTPYPVTLNIKLDGENMSSDGNTYQLKLSTDETKIVQMYGGGTKRTAGVPNGIWKVYLSWNDKYTGVNINVNDGPASATLDWYSGEFRTDSKGTAINSTIDVSINGESIYSDSAYNFLNFIKGDEVTFTANGKGAESYTYTWSGSYNGNPISGIGKIYTIDSAEGKVNIVCTITGNGVATTNTVTVNSPGTGASGSGNYRVGQLVYISAGAAPSEANVKFKNWTFSPSLSFVNENNANISFIMPAHPISATANFGPIPEGEKAIYVFSDGNGIANTSHNSATTGSSIILTATANSGYCFKEWQVIAGNVSIQEGLGSPDGSVMNHSFTMPDSEVRLKAIFEAKSVTSYTVTFDLNGGTRTGGGELTQIVPEGSAATAPIVTRSNYTFTSWDKDFSKVTSNLTVKAGWSYNSSGGNNGGGSGGSGGGGADTTQSIVQPTIPASDGSVKVEYTTSNGVISLSMSNSKVNEIIAKAKNGEVVFDLQTIKDSNSVKIPKNALSSFVKAKLDLAIKLPEGTTTIDNKALESILKQSTGTADMKLELKQIPTSNLSAAQKESINSGDLVFDINILMGTKNITEFDGALTIELPYKGELPVAVWYLNNKGELEKIESSYKNGVVSFILNHLSLYVVRKDKTIIETEDKWVNPFIDVREDSWVYDAVKYVYENDLMKGTSDKTFSPDGITTRGMIVTILHRLEGSPSAETNRFSDVKADKYYANAVAWAAENNIVNGYDNDKFGPEDAITREQLAVILMNYANNKGYDVKSRADLSKYEDSKDISNWAINALSWANATGLIEGGKNSLAPLAEATRTQVATILNRLVEDIVK